MRWPSSTACAIPARRCRWWRSPPTPPSETESAVPRGRLRCRADQAARGGASCSPPSTSCARAAPPHRSAARPRRRAGGDADLVASALSRRRRRDRARGDDRVAARAGRQRFRRRSRGHLPQRRRPARRPSCARRSSAANLAEFAELTHSLRSGAANIGGVRLCQTLTALEDMTRQGAAPGRRSVYVEKIESELVRLEAALEPFARAHRLG